jgi:hypothetical protein
MCCLPQESSDQSQRLPCDGTINGKGVTVTARWRENDLFAQFPLHSRPSQEIIAHIERSSYDLVLHIYPLPAI